MARKKTTEVAITETTVSSLTDKKYHALLVEHRTLCELWATIGRTAASRYPVQLSKIEANMYKLIVKLSVDAETKFNEIVKLNLHPQPEHRLIPLSSQVLFPNDADAEKWFKETDKKLQELTKQWEAK